MNPFDNDQVWNNVVAENILSKLPTELMNKIVDYVPKPIYKKSKEFKAGLYTFEEMKRDEKRLGTYQHPIYTEYNRTMWSFKKVKLLRDLNKENSAKVYTVKETPKQFKIHLDFELIGISGEKNMILKKSHFEQRQGYKYYNHNNKEWIWIEEDCDNIDIVVPWKDYYEYNIPCKNVLMDKKYFDKLYQDYNSSA